MSNPLIHAAQQKMFDQTLIALVSPSEINSATKWAVEHNNLTMMNALRPHSKYNTIGGLHPLLCLAIAHGSTDVLESLGSQMVAHTITSQDNAVGVHALKSTSTVGLRWLIKNRQRFGLNNDYFAHLLETVSEQVSFNAVDVVIQQFPKQRFEWLRMVVQCAEHNDLERCLWYIHKTHHNRTETTKQMGRAFNAVVEHLNPADFEIFFTTVEHLWKQNIETMVHVPRLFATALKRNTSATEAIVSLSKHFGEHVDCSSLGADCVESIQGHKALHLKKIISQAVIPVDNTPHGKLRKL